MLRRLLTTMLVAVVLPMGAVATTAQAAEDVQISGVIKASDTLSAWIVQFCSADTSNSCVSGYVNSSTGEFSQQVAPGTYNVQIILRHGVRHASYLRQTLTLSESAVWQLRLPELVKVHVTALDAAGSRVPGASIDFRGGERADDMRLSPDLPAFSAKAYYDDLTTNLNGGANLLAFPDSKLTIPVYGRVDDVAMRFPLDTPSRSWVDGHAGASVVAQALPLHTIDFSLKDSAGERVPGALDMVGRWGATHGVQVSDTGPVSFEFPTGAGTMTLRGGPGSGGQLPESWYVDQQLRITGDRSLTLKLPRAVHLEGTVKDADTSGPVEGAVVTLGGRDDPADPSVLAQGLKPASLYEGAPWSSTNGLIATSDADGHVGFVTFPDSDLTFDTTLRKTGVYRTAPSLHVDASDDTTFTHKLPKSVTVTADFTDHQGNGTLLNTASLRLSKYSSVPFAVDGPSRLTMITNPGHVTIDARLDQSSTDVRRRLDVTGDTLLTMQGPETHKLTVLGIDYTGAGFSMAFDATGTTSVTTESGPVDATFRTRRWLDNNAQVTIDAPLTTDATISAQDPEQYSASITHLDLSSDRSVVLQAGQDFVGAGAPYVLFDQVDPFIMDADGKVSWHGIEATSAWFERTVASPFGKNSSERVFGLPVSGQTQTYRGLAYAKGVTTCFGATASRGDVTGPPGMEACRTRPLDDRAFFASGPWHRVDQDAAYSGSFRQTSDRGAMLSLGALDVVAGRSPGGLRLLAHPSPDAGTVRLMMHGEWISAPLSLQGPLADQPQLLPITLDSNVWTMTGKLHVVVVSDGKPVRVDGIAIPALPNRPLLPPL